MMKQTKNFVWLDDESMHLIRTLASVTGLRTVAIARGILRRAYADTFNVPCDALTIRSHFLRYYPDIAPKPPETSKEPTP